MASMIVEDSSNVVEKFHEVLLQNHAVLSQIDVYINTALSNNKCAKPLITEILELERDSWELMFALYLDRFSEIHSDLKTKPFSEKSVLQDLYNRDSLLREVQILIDWLEGRSRRVLSLQSAKIESLFTDAYIWENTRHEMEHSTLLSSLITELHPDAAICSGKKLHKNDLVDEQKYCNYLFSCLRSGDIQRAQNLCIKRGDHWRAASLEGWRPFQFETDEGIEEPCVAGNPLRSLNKSVSWWNSEDQRLFSSERAIYAAMSGNLEALLRSLREIDSRRVSFSASHWDDVTWAYCRSYIESCIYTHLLKETDTGPAKSLSITGSFNFQDLGLPDPVLPLPDSALSLSSLNPHSLFARIDSHLGWSPKSTLLQMLHSWETSEELPPFLLDDNSSVISYAALDSTPPHTLHGSMLDQSRAPARLGKSKRSLATCIFYAVRQAIALRHYTELLPILENLASVLVKLALGSRNHPVVSGNDNFLPRTRNRCFVNGQGDDTFKHLLRFLVHFLLALKELESSLPGTAFEAALEGYLTLLIADEDGSLIADYVSLLPTQRQQIAWYALYLSGLQSSQERKQGIADCLRTGLDLQRISRAVIRIMRRNPAVFSGEEDLQSSVAWPESASRLSPVKAPAQDMNVVEWLTYDTRNQRCELLALVNSLLRQFLEASNVPSMQKLIASLPAGSIEQAKLVYDEEKGKSTCPPWLSLALAEFEALQTYIRAQEAFNDWFKYFHSHPSPKPVPHVDRFRSLAQKMAHQEQVKTYEQELQKWHDELAVYVHNAATQLKQLLLYKEPGWLVDVMEDNTCIDSNSASEEEVAQAGQKRSLSSRLCCSDEPDELDALVKHGYPSLMTGRANLTGVASLGESRQHRVEQMRALRQQVLSQAIQLLTRVYQKSNLHKECLRLADLVADEKHALYKLMNTTELENFMQSMHESALTNLEETGDPLRYANLEVLGWRVDKEKLNKLLASLDLPDKAKQVTNDNLLNLNLREFGEGWISDCKQSENSYQFGGQIAQVVRVQNLGLPLNDQSEDGAAAAGEGGRGTKPTDVIRIIITDGKTQLSVLDLNQKCKIGTNLPPGTKIKLDGKLSFQLGHLVIHHENQALTKLGGSVEALVREWKLGKQIQSNKHRRLLGPNGPPPFAPFGTRDAQLVLQNQAQFLSNKRKITFNSYEEALKASQGGKTKLLRPEEMEAEAKLFESKRSEVIAAAKQNASESTVNYSRVFLNMPKFRKGGSLFSCKKLEKLDETDQLVAKLVAMDYPAQLATAALKINKNNMQAALDYLRAKEHKPASAPVMRGRGRGRGQRGRGGAQRSERTADPLDVDDRYDTARPGQSRATDKVSIDLGSMLAGMSLERSKERLQPCKMLTMGCPILAQGIDGSYKQAICWGKEQTGYEVVVRVAYEDAKSIQELVPINLIRSVEMKHIDPATIPNASGGQNRVNFNGTNYNRGGAAFNRGGFNNQHNDRPNTAPVNPRGRGRGQGARRPRR
ncbi:hypothetical protein Ciccas_005635 [Cichlidogyrus casuarinus]|uniref:UBA domain-containing protein n=1 Tax=Cichlidogyrus casuarinus TaxID=1844966 RepID=A0ABD2Q8K4_9PLAT